MSEDKNALIGQKEVAYYSALINAWITTRMEKDKQLLTLSSAGIGLIVFFQPKLTGIIEFGIWIFSGICFLFSIGILLSIFSENSDLIEAQINDSQSTLKQKLDKKIEFKTKLAGWLFISGAILAFLLAISQTNFIQIKSPHGGIQHERQK